MKQDPYLIGYNREKNRKMIYFYVEMLCEILKLRYEYGFKDITDKDVLSELPSLRNFTKSEVDKIYTNAIELLRIKYNIEVIQDNPFVFKDNRKRL